MSDEAGHALTEALRMLARRDFSRALLEERLRGRGHSPEAAEFAALRCVELRYIDDHDFGVTRATELLHRKPSGRRALLHDLQRQGLARTMAEQVAEDVYSEAGGEAAVLGTALRRWIDRYGEPVDWRAVKRCSDHLGRRGFAGGAIQAALSPWLDELAS